MKSESKLKESVSYSEDFEDDKSIPLTQSAAYQKMLSTVDVSDEEDDLEEEFLEGNTIGPRNRLDVLRRVSYHHKHWRKVLNSLRKQLR